MTNNDKKFVIFDLDGTLIDSYECILCCVNSTLKFYGFSSIKTSQSKNQKNIEFLFKTAKNLVQEIIPYSDFKIKFDIIHADNYIKGVKVNIAAYHLLERYYNKGFFIVVLTNKLRLIASKICQYFFPTINFIIIGRENENPIKADWQNVAIKISEHHLSLDSCLFYVGDSETDKALAYNLNINYIDIEDVNYSEHEVLE